MDRATRTACACVGWSNIERAIRTQRESPPCVSRIRTGRPASDPRPDRADPKERPIMSLLRVPMGPGISRPVTVLLTALIVAAMLVPMVSAPAPVRAASAYTTDYLNLRAGPSSSNYIKLVMPPGSYVDLISDLGRSAYYKVTYQGELGYAHSDYLSVGGGDNVVDAGWGNAGTAFTT